MELISSYIKSLLHIGCDYKLLNNGDQLLGTVVSLDRNFLKLGMVDISLCDDPRNIKSTSEMSLHVDSIKEYEIYGTDCSLP
ncbi:hypothetical protein TCA2_4494 [Paenibacillus sp. TCA20]|nr:hypothetical protein TCA2_4494 [Paenibacillus sp. TCA20]